MQVAEEIQQVRLNMSRSAPARPLDSEPGCFLEAYSQTGIIYIKTRQPRRAYMKAACFSK
jgi:hypothetical protein